MSHPHTMSMSRAASLLDITRPALFKLLRQGGYLMHNNLPQHQLVVDGLMVVRIRSHHNAVTGISKQYAVTHVTGAGLSWLQTLVDHAKTTQTVRRRHHRPAHPRSPARSAQPGARAFA